MNVYIATSFRTEISVQNHKGEEFSDWIVSVTTFDAIKKGTVLTVILT
jgi:hypothetical protein